MLIKVAILDLHLVMAKMKVTMKETWLKIIIFKLKDIKFIKLSEMKKKRKHFKKYYNFIIFI
jgi:hypothetical protein